MIYRIFINDANGAYSARVSKSVSKKRGQAAVTISDFDSEEEAIAFAKGIQSEIKPTEYLSICRYSDDGEIDGDYDFVL